MDKTKLIEELKLVKKETGITYQEIADKTLENGEAVSLSTIKLVFSDKKKHNHDYEHVLRPIANVLSPPANDNLDILKTRLELKDEVIKQLQSRIKKKDDRHQEQESFYKEQLQFYKEQIQFKDLQIKKLTEAIDRKDNIIREMLIENTR